MRNKLLWGLMTLLSLLTVLLVSRYLTLDPDVFFPEQRAVYLAHLTTLIIHVIGSMLALALGPFLLLNQLRIKWPAVHRWLGRLYLLGNLFGGVAGLYMSTYAYTGGTTSVAFALLGLLWLATGFMAFVRIRAGNVPEHRRWMVRNFALTLAGVMLRLQTVFLATAFGFEVGYMIVAWTCWVPNLLVAEWILRQQRSPVARTLVKTMRLHEA